MNGKAAIKVCQKIIANKEQCNDKPVSPSIKGLKINLVRIMKDPDKCKGQCNQNYVQKFDASYNRAFFQ